MVEEAGRVSFALPELTATVKAVDEASAVFEEVQASAKESMGQVEKATQGVEAANEQMTTNLRGVVTGFSGVATSAFALYNAYDRVQDMTVSVDRAQLTLHTTLNSLQNAQEKYNEAVEKYGADSEQAADAAETLELAQERYEVAVERADMLQGNLNETMVSSALMVVPSLINMVDSLDKIRQSHTVTMIAEKLGLEGLSASEVLHAVVAKASAAAQWVLNAAMNANPIFLVVTAIGALVAIFAVAYATCEPFRNAVDQIGATLTDVFKPAIDAVSGALSWLWSNVVQPFIDGLRWLADSLASVAGWFISIGSNATTSSGMIDSYTQSMIDLYDTVGQPPSTGLIESFEFLDKAMKGIEAPELSISPSVDETMKGIPLRTVTPARSVTLNMNSPLVNIEGSADRETARLAASLVKEELRNVLVEASSSSAPGTHKRVRSGGLINVA
jgi:phage-related protein